MAKQTLNNGETHGVIRTKINDNFSEVYEDISNKTAVGHSHYIGEVTGLAGSLSTLEAHVASAHAPSNATPDQDLSGLEDKPTPIADIEALYSLTGLSVGDTYKLDDTSHIWEYLGGGEADIGNWLDHSYNGASLGIEPKYIINTMCGYLSGTVESGAIGYRDDQGVVAAPSTSIPSSGINQLVSPKFLGACFGVSTSPDLDLNNTFTKIGCRHLSDVLDLRSKNALVNIVINDFLPGATVLLPDSTTVNVSEIRMYDNTSTSILRLRNTDYLSSGLLTLYGNSTIFYIRLYCYVSRTDLPSLNVSIGDRPTYVRITDNPKLTSCTISFAATSGEFLAAVNITDNPMLTSILLPGLYVDDYGTSSTYYGVDASNNALETDAVYEMIDAMIAGTGVGGYSAVVNVSGNPCQIGGVLHDGVQYSAADVTALATAKLITLIHTA